MEQSKQWLPISWKVMAAYGILFIFFAILVPFASYFALPNQPSFVFGPADEKFTGLTWDKIAALNLDFGLWVVLTMVSMCAMMMSAGVLTFMISKTAYREGKRWAWRALAIAHVFVLVVYYLFFIGGLHIARGLPFWTLYPGSSGLGADWFIIVGIVWLYFGLWLPRRELKD